MNKLILKFSASTTVTIESRDTRTLKLILRASDLYNRAQSRAIVGGALVAPKPGKRAASIDRGQSRHDVALNGRLIVHDSAMVSKGKLSNWSSIGACVRMKRGARRQPMDQMTTCQMNSVILGHASRMFFRTLMLRYNQLWVGVNLIHGPVDRGILYYTGYACTSQG